MKNLTIGITSYNRYRSLNRLINSIYHYYPSMGIMVADDSDSNLIHDTPVDSFFYLSQNSGLSLKRNFLVDKCRTPYLLILEDDFCFTEETNLELMFQTLKEKKADIVAGMPVNNGVEVHYAYDLDLKDKILFMSPIPRPEQGGFASLVPNFLLGHTSTFIYAPWDNDFEMGEHTDWALTAWCCGIKIYYEPRVKIDHTPLGPPDKEYLQHRSGNAGKYEEMFKKKWNLIATQRTDHPRTAIIEPIITLPAPTPITTKPDIRSVMDEEKPLLKEEEITDEQCKTMISLPLGQFARMINNSSNLAFLNTLHKKMLTISSEDIPVTRIAMIAERIANLCPLKEKNNE